MVVPAAPQLVGGVVQGGGVPDWSAATTPCPPNAAYVATVLPRAVLRELRAGRPASAGAVVAALAATTAGYLRGRLPGATSGVRLPAADPGVRSLDSRLGGD